MNNFIINVLSYGRPGGRFFIHITSLYTVKDGEDVFVIVYIKYIITRYKGHKSFHSVLSFPQRDVLDEHREIRRPIDAFLHLPLAMNVRAVGRTHGRFLVFKADHMFTVLTEPQVRWEDHERGRVEFLFVEGIVGVEGQLPRDTGHVFHLLINNPTRPPHAALERVDEVGDVEKEFQFDEADIEVKQERVLSLNLLRLAHLTDLFSGLQRQTSMGFNFDVISGVVGLRPGLGQRGQTLFKF